MAFVRTPWLIWPEIRSVCPLKSSMGPGLATRSELFFRCFKSISFHVNWETPRGGGFNIATPPKIVTVVGQELQCLWEIYDGPPVQIDVPDFKTDTLSSSEHSFFLSYSQGMVYSAEYIKKKLEQEMILSQAFGRDLVSDSVYFTKEW